MEQREGAWEKETTVAAAMAAGAQAVAGTEAVEREVAQQVAALEESVVSRACRMETEVGGPGAASKVAAVWEVEAAAGAGQGAAVKVGVVAVASTVAAAVVAEAQLACLMEQPAAPLVEAKLAEGQWG